RVGYQLSGNKELTKDLLQAFFLELWESRFQSQNIQYLEAYLKKAFHRKVVKALQQRAKTQPICDQQQNLIVPSYETLLVNLQQNDQLKKQLRQAINGLPSAQKKALTLRFKDGLDYEEIAQSTGKSQQTIYNQIHQAISKLKKHFF
ncbi:MAG: sigma-70 family RNA polymerase sigma factor, partial [Bacteroidota bacterium]